jgi:hypothetical protein
MQILKEKTDLEITGAGHISPSGKSFQSFKNSPGAAFTSIRCCNAGRLATIKRNHRPAMAVLSSANDIP